MLLTGLVGGVEYCAALQASNESGTTVGFQVAFAEHPTVASLSPASGPAAGGTTVTIKGENLGGTVRRALRRGGREHRQRQPRSGHRELPGKRGGSVDVTVTTPAGTSATSEADLYTYEGAGATGAHGLQRTDRLYGLHGHDRLHWDDRLHGHHRTRAHPSWAKASRSASSISR